MRSLALAAIVFTLSATGSFAQTEAQKRRAHLPYVKAATDCFANGILANETAMRHAEAGRWYDALSAVQTCGFAVRQMVTQHDLIYGGGGEDFFKGPYVADLPRAISARVKPELERRALAALERQRAEQAALAERERAKKDQENARGELLRSEWAEHRKCLTDSLVSILPNSSENAEAITTAIMSLCRSHESKLVKLASALYGLSQSEAESAIAKNMAERRADVTKEIVVIRAAAQASKGNSAPSGGGTIPASPNKERSF
jgi:hypothetical protein